MSAIAGIVKFDGSPVEEDWISALTQAMRSWGPHGQTHVVLQGAALGHCMLRATPESLVEVQPLSAADAQLTLVWDGRLDNRPELQEALASHGCRLRDNSDAELVLNSYIAWGPDCARHLLGDFAFAVWDGLRRRLYCARDGMGARPFFFTRTGQFFAFASDDEALTQLPGVPWVPNDERVAHYLAPSYMGFDPRETWLRNVFALGPGQSLLLEAGEHQLTTYWRLEAGTLQQFKSDEECEQAFLAVFKEAVRCRTRSNGDIGVMASGGLDSASVAAVASMLLPDTHERKLHGYSAVSDDESACVESQCIRQVTSRLMDRAHTVSVPSFTGMVNVEDLLAAAWTGAHPVDNSILLPALMCRAAARDGHHVMLHGASGDLTTHASYAYLFALARKGQWRHGWSESLEAGMNHPAWLGKTRLRVFGESVYRGFVPAALQTWIGRLRLGKGPLPRSPSVISPALAQRVGLGSHRVARPAQNKFSADAQSSHLKALAPPFGITSTLGAYNRVAGKAGIELRDPWADRRVVEFWVRLPLHYKFRHGWTKYLVRSTFRNMLPEQVLKRTGKEHVGWNFFYRVLSETVDQIRVTLDYRLRAIDNWVDADCARQVFAAYLAGREHHDQEAVYDMMALAAWVSANPSSGTARKINDV